MSGALIAAAITVGPAATTPAFADTCYATPAVYGVTNTGVLAGYTDNDPSGGGGPISSTGMSNATWGSLTKVFTGGNGVIYGVDGNGALRSYKDADPLDAVAPGAGKVYGTGWAGYRLLWGDPQGVIYGISTAGVLQTWKQSDPVDGTGAITAVSNFGSTWGGIRLAWSNGHGLIYAIDNAGNLRDYIHTGYAAGNGTVTSGGMTPLPSWGGIAIAWSPGPTGIIYGISTSGVLNSYVHDDPVGGAGTVRTVKSPLNTTWGSMKVAFGNVQSCSTPTDACVGITFTNPNTCAQAVALAKALVSSTPKYLVGVCDHYVAVFYGHPASLEDNAAIHWNDILSNHRQWAHPGLTDVPSGGLAFFTGGSQGRGHVMISIGGGSYISTDIHGDGTITTTTLSEVLNTWGNLTYVGWANPWFPASV